MVKKKVGVFSFTCCEGCVIVFLEALNKRYDEWMKKMKIVNMRQLRTNEKIGNLDIAFVEGSVSTESEVRKLKLIRSKTKKLVAVGSGAVNGYPSDQRNKFSRAKKAEIKELVGKLNQIDNILPITKVVKVDAEIDGCPISEADLIKKIDGWLK